MNYFFLQILHSHSKMDCDSIRNNFMQSNLLSLLLVPSSWVPSPFHGLNLSLKFTPDPGMEASYD